MTVTLASSSFVAPRASPRARAPRVRGVRVRHRVSASAGDARAPARFPAARRGRPRDFGLGRTRGERRLPAAARARGLPELACDGELVTAPSGLQYCDAVVGSGKAPAARTTIKAHYTGRLTDGRVFDSSYSRGSPLQFKVGAGQVIKGWDDGILGTEGVPPMRVGGKRILVIPANLGYGDRGAGGGLIPGGATLKFDVELVDAP